MKRAKLPKRKQLKRYSWDVSLWKLLWKWNSRQQHTAFRTKYIPTFQLYSFYFDGPLRRILFVCDYLKCPFSKSTLLRRALKHCHKNNSLPSSSDYCSSGTLPVCDRQYELAGLLGLLRWDRAVDPQRR
jgi:hypothetical protein